MKVIGLNLSPDESSPSGIAQLEDKRIRTFTVYKNSEISELLSRFSPEIVIAKFPVFVSEKEFRTAEKEMQQLGYTVDSINSEKTVKTANRASHFRHEFEEDFDFIETKLELAKKELGITNVSELNNVKILNIIKNEFERDAVICAVVGAFFLENKYADFGDDETGKVILPRLD